MIRLIQQPNIYSLTGNPVILTVESDDESIQYFNVTLLDNEDNLIQSIKAYCTPLTTLRATADLSNILSAYTSTDITNDNEYISTWSAGTIKYKVVILERILVDGLITDGDAVELNDFTASDGEVSDFDYISGNSAKYIVSPNTEFFYKASSTIDTTKRIKPNSIEWIYYHKSFVLGEVLKVNISINGTLHTSNINNNNNMVKVDISPSTLANQFNLNKDEIKTIEVYLSDSTGYKITESKRFIVQKSNCRDEEINLLWINSLGGVDSYSFLNYKETQSVSNKVTLSNNSIRKVVNGVVSSKSQLIYNTKQSQYNLITDQLNDAEARMLSGIIDSKEVYVKLVNGVLYPVEVVNSSFSLIRTKFNKGGNRRISLSFTSDPNLPLVENINQNTGFTYTFDFNLS